MALTGQLAEDIGWAKLTDQDKRMLMSERATQEAYFLGNSAASKAVRGGSGGALVEAREGDWHPGALGAVLAALKARHGAEMKG